MDQTLWEENMLTMMLQPDVLHPSEEAEFMLSRHVNFSLDTKNYLQNTCSRSRHLTINHAGHTSFDFHFKRGGRERTERASFSFKYYLQFVRGHQHTVGNTARIMQHAFSGYLQQLYG